MQRLKSVCKWLVAIFLILSVVAFMRCYDKKNNYYYSEYSRTQNQNAYVGGDAYNYIINAGYFTGYLVAGSACLISASAFGAVWILLCAKEQQEKNAGQQETSPSGAAIPAPKAEEQSAIQQPVSIQPPAEQPERPQQQA